MSGLALVCHQFRYDQKAFWRNPASVFFTVMFPVFLLLIFATVFGGQTVDVRGGIKATTYYVPAIITLAVISATMQTPGDVAGDRPRGRPAEARPRHADAGLGLHRRPDRQLDRGRADDAGAAGRDRRAPLRRRRSPGTGCRRSLVTLVVGAAAFCCLGIALTAAIPSQDAAAPIVNALLLPLYFLSGVFIPDDQLPSGVIHFADLFPIRHFFEAFFDAYVPRQRRRRRSISWDNLAVVAIWGVAGLLLAVRFFRWTPRERLSSGRDDFPGARL